MGGIIVFVLHVTYLLKLIHLRICKISCPCCVPTYVMMRNWHHCKRIRTFHRNGSGLMTIN